LLKLLIYSKNHTAIAD